jgi:hypothetical protein
MQRKLNERGRNKEAKRRERGIMVEIKKGKR